MATQPVLEKNMAQQMVRMFDGLYRQGVTDCISLEDEGRCREFLEATAEPGVYGLLTDDYYITPIEWQLRLQMIAGRISLKSPMYKLFCRMGNVVTNWLGCFLPLASDFYRKGIKDALNYGSKVDLAMLNSKTKVWITEKGLTNVDNHLYKQEIQQMCYNRQRAERAFMDGYKDIRTSKHQRIGENDARKRVRNPMHWEQFVVRISCLTGITPT